MEPMGEMQREVSDEQGAIAPLRKWFFGDEQERPLTPFAAINLRSFIENRLKENSAAATEEALFWQNAGRTQ